MENLFRRIVHIMAEKPEVRAIIEEILDLIEQNNNINLSSIRIDQQCRIFLTGYNNAELLIEGYQAKTLYIFYLLSPVCISNADIEQYKDILIDIYLEIYNKKEKGRGRARDFINGLLNPKDGKKGRGLSDATNKIRKALKDAIPDEKILRKYSIEGKRSGGRKISLPKKYILIENDALKEIAKSRFRETQEEDN